MEPGHSGMIVHFAERKGLNEKNLSVKADRFFCDWQELLHVLAQYFC